MRILLLALLLLTACAPASAGSVPTTFEQFPTAPGELPNPIIEQTNGPAAPTPTSVPTTTPAATPTPEPTPVVLPTPTPSGPQEINGIPLSAIVPMPPDGVAHVREIYARGIELGRDPHAFSKLGDSTILNPHFLGPFDTGDYNLGNFAHLQPALSRWRGSFARHGVASHFGLHSWTVFDPLWADAEWCLPNEHALACEVRLNNPSVLYVRLGSNDADAPDGFRYNVRKVIEYCIDNGIIPIIGTKADRFEGSNENNDILRALAAEYRVPLWDFDLLAETLPGRGLGDDGVHLVIDELPHDYTQPNAFGRGHAMQDLTALMALDGVRRVLE